MKIVAIVAVANNNVIGNENRIPWYLPADLKYFKKITLNHPVIMGRKCYESIGRPLPKRTNIVLTRNPFFIASGIVSSNSKEEALAIANATESEQVFIIGGEQIYDLFWEETQEIYLTRVDLEAEGTITFPELSSDKWELVSKEDHKAHGKNEYDYSFQKYIRK